MALYKYFAPAKPSLPKPNGPLSAVVPSSSIAAANKEVTKVLEEELDQKDATPKSARGEYERFTPEEKARIGKRAAEHGVPAAIRYFSKVFPGRSLKESTVRTWKKRYLQEISGRKRAGEAVTVEALENKKTGRPLMLSQDLDKQVQSYLAALRESGAVVNTAIVIACAMGVVKSHDSNPMVGISY